MTTSPLDVGCSKYAKSVGLTMRITYSQVLRFAGEYGSLYAWSDEGSVWKKIELGRGIVELVDLVDKAKEFKFRGVKYNRAELEKLLGGATGQR